MNYKIDNKTKILVISGATASGKSALAHKIAQENDAVIINADSIQLYQELPILSAQPDEEDKKKIPHFLYSILKYNQNSSLDFWLKKATNIINQTFNNNKLPIIVGGTGLYIKHLIYGISEIPIIDEQIRNEVRELYENCSKEELVKILISLNDKRNKIIDLDKQRLSRRIEVLKQTGKDLSWWQEQPKKIFYPQNYFHHINLTVDRKIIYQNCNQRFKNMLENGAIKEVQDLIKDHPNLNSPITKTIGFIEIKDYLQNKISKEKMIEIASQKTRNYAKRQLTWFRHQFK